MLKPGRGPEGRIEPLVPFQPAVAAEEEVAPVGAGGVIGTEEVEAGLLIIASGFSGCENYITEFMQPLQNAEGVFTAGDLKSGASLVVLAMADGKRAAIEADKYLMGYTNME